jgi:flagellar motor component MotA
MSAITGGFIAISLILLGIMLGSPLIIFFDVVSVLLVGGGSIALLMAAHGIAGLGTVGRAARCWFCGSTTGWSSAELAHAARVSKTGGKAAMLTGWVGAMIGVVQILQYLVPSDLTALGPACAVMVLTVFYALCLKLVLWVPLEAWLTEQAQRTAAVET